MAYVYFIQNTRTKLIKIGFAKDPKQRMMNLQTGSSDLLKLLGTMPGNQEDEKWLHRRLRHDRVQGEWYDITERRVTEMIEVAARVQRENPQMSLPLERPSIDPDELVFTIIVKAA